MNRALPLSNHRNRLPATTIGRDFLWGILDIGLYYTEKEVRIAVGI